MDSELRNTNLFRYATSELSQDAFICWLLSHATESGWKENPQLGECAVAFLNEILNANGLNLANSACVTDIKRQYEHIDVLIEINHKLNIIIEDKTFTNTHDNQINRYKKILLDKGIPEDNILRVFYKIEDQPSPENNVDFEFTRKNLLELFRPYVKSAGNTILSDYVEYLESIEHEVNSYQTLPISKWSDNAYRGFFIHLSETVLKDVNMSWGYVSNPSGGFMGLWWGSGDLDNIGSYEQYRHSIYLQIEKNIIALKYSIDHQDNEKNEDEIRKIRWKLYDYFHQKLGDEFQKKPFRPGKWMTVGYIRYDETNYLEKIKAMQSAFSGLLKNEKLV